MESNIPSATLKAGSTPKIEYIKLVLGQATTYTHRTQCNSALWHHRYPKAFVHLATMQSVGFNMMDTHQESLDEVSNHFKGEVGFVWKYLDYIFDYMIINTSFNLASGQILASLEDGVIPSSKLGQLTSAIRRLEDLLGSRLEPPSPRGGSSPIPGLEDLTSPSESSSTYWSFGTPSDSWLDPHATKLSINVIPSLLAEGSSSESSAMSKDEAEVADAGKDGEGENDSRGPGGSFSAGGELGV
jgi:hypothetical protein